MPCTYSTCYTRAVASSYTAKSRSGKATLRWAGFQAMQHAPSALNRDLIGTSPAIRTLIMRASARERGNAAAAAAGNGSQVPVPARARICACACALCSRDGGALCAAQVCVHLPFRKAPVSVRAASEVLYASSWTKLDDQSRFEHGDGWIVDGGGGSQLLRMDASSCVCMCVCVCGTQFPAFTRPQQ
ncbi:hypothetical protein CCMA1212_006000 [Trichoderma ghanense]|uniref:Uncharacterized protein n=1 Tax=Trichoderma ghanense TaxID=65468 RepID=A0ABY2H3P7_9HYPO